MAKKSRTEEPNQPLPHPSKGVAAQRKDMPIAPATSASPQAVNAFVRGSGHAN